jgi:hypothetical protein
MTAIPHDDLDFIGAFSIVRSLPEIGVERVSVSERKLFLQRAFSIDNHFE